MILAGKELSLEIQKDLKNQAAKLGTDKYVAIIFLGDDYSSATYVNHKQKYGEAIGIPVAIFGQYKKTDLPSNQEDKFNDISIYIKQNYDSIFKIMELISFLNYDKDCLGIIVQLPLPEKFKEYQSQILSAISPTKDIDGLGGVLTGLTEIGRIDFTPATPKAVFTLLKHYKLDNLKGKTVAILGQSNIVGKPLAVELINQGATVYTCNADTPQAQIKTITKMADYIISCTGKVYLIDESYIRDDKSQILIDVGYGHIDGKPVGDINIPSIENKVSSYTPVPGGIGPLTVACLFDNVFVLQKNKEILKQYKL